MYLGDSLYHHWTPFLDVAHATVKVTDEAGYEATSVISAIGSWSDLVPRFRLTVKELFIIPKRDDEHPEVGR